MPLGYGKMIKYAEVDQKSPFVTVPPQLQECPNHRLSRPFINLAISTGLNSNVHFLRQRFENLLNRNRVGIYSYADVEKFLDARFGMAKIRKATNVSGVPDRTYMEQRTWVWQPLTETDAHRLQWDPGLGKNGQFLSECGWFQGELPAKLISILAKARNEMPELFFFVSANIVARTHNNISVSRLGYVLPFVSGSAIGLHPVVFWKI